VPPPQFAEGEVEFVLAAVGGQVAQDGRGHNPARPYRGRYAQHIRQHRTDQLSVYLLPKERIDIGVALLATGTKQCQVFPIADAGHELDPQQVRQSEA
jgi:hypothetical protein